MPCGSKSCVEIQYYVEVQYQRVVSRVWCCGKNVCVEVSRLPGSRSTCRSAESLFQHRVHRVGARHDVCGQSVAKPTAHTEVDETRSMMQNISARWQCLTAAMLCPSFLSSESTIRWESWRPLYRQHTYSSLTHAFSSSRDTCVDSGEGNCCSVRMLCAIQIDNHMATQPTTLHYHTCSVQLVELLKP